MRVTLDLDDARLQAALRDLSEKQVRTAASWALNDTAADVLSHVQERMEEVFDRPTRFAKNAFMVWRSRPGDLVAEVKERPSVGRRHFLKVQEVGGPRPQTGLEGMLNQTLAYDGYITATAPASGAKLNAYGNWSIGERNQALSAVQAQRDSKTNTTKDAKKRHRKRAGFFVPRADSRLSPGIWKRDADGTISKVLHFTRTVPVYDPRLGFLDGAEEVFAARLPDHLRRTLEKVAARGR